MNETLVLELLEKANAFLRAIVACGQSLDEGEDRKAAALYEQSKESFERAIHDLENSL